MPGPAHRRLAGLLALAAWLVAAHPAWAQAPAGDAAERARIARERDEARAQYDRAHAACGERFAATACENAARAQRREAMDRLARQEALLDNAQRRQRAAERLKRIEQKMSTSDARGEAAQAKPAPLAVKVRRPDAASPADGAALRPAPGHAASGAAAPHPQVSGEARRAGTLGARGAERAQAEERRAARAAREARAQAHRQEVEARNAARQKKHPPAAPLPVPPASAGAR